MIVFLENCNMLYHTCAKSDRRCEGSAARATISSGRGYLAQVEELHDLEEDVKTLQERNGYDVTMLQEEHTWVATFVVPHDTSTLIAGRFDLDRSFRVLVFSSFFREYFEHPRASYVLPPLKSTLSLSIHTFLTVSRHPSTTTTSQVGQSRVVS